MKLNLLYVGVALSFLSNVATWTVSLADMSIPVPDEESPEQNKNEFQYDNNDTKSEYLIDKTKYAKEYEYQGYKETKLQVTNAIHSGSRYLEGLSRALMEYRKMLESCGDTNLTVSVNKTEQIQPEAKTTCSTATKNGKIVQRLSELALQTAKKLKDRTYDMDKDGESEENELLLQLAWFLDHLARLTGYVPDINSFSTTDTSQPIDDTTAVTKSEKDTSLELLETVENGRTMSKTAPTVTADKTVVKRSIESIPDVVKYYTKYHLWNGSNLNTSNSNFDIDNDIKSIKRRSIPRNKYGYLRYKNVTKMTNKIRRISKLRKRIFKVIVVKKLKH